MNSADVFIVGAGPVGLTLAAECQRQGVSFRIVDQNATHSQHSKALAVWSVTIEHLAALGLAETFLANGRSIRRAIFEDGGKEIAEIHITEGLDTLYPAPFILPQSETEELLIEHLQTVGVNVERSVECLDLRQATDGVECDLQLADGSTETVVAKWVAGCDGARSVVRHKLPVEFPGVTEKFGFILADAKATGGLPTDGMMVSSGLGGNVIIFPVKGDIWRVFALRGEDDDRSEPTLEEIQQHLDGAGLERVRLSEPQWLSHFVVNERVVSRNRVGRVFLLGDASHIHSPAGGQGMNTGMQDAFNLGWKLKLLTSGGGHEEMIAESYFEERHPIALQVVHETSRLLHFGVKSHSLIRAAKKLVLPWLADLEVFKKKMSYQLSELGISYPAGSMVERDSVTLRHHKDLAPGTLARPVDVEKDGQVVSLWRELLHPGFTLLLFSGPNASGQTQLLELKKYASPAVRILFVLGEKTVPSPFANDEVLLDPESAAHARYGLSESGWYLVRPDQYIAARGVASEEPVLGSYLARIGQLIF